MDELIFVRPSGVWQQQIADYRREFEASGDSIDGSGGLKTAHSLEDWLKAQDENTREETVRGGFVPATTFLGVRASDSRLVGMVNIRRPHRVQRPPLGAPPGLRRPAAGHGPGGVPQAGH